MQRAVGRATVALEQTRQKLGAARSVNLEVSQLVGVAQIQDLRSYSFDSLEHTNGESINGGIFGAHNKVAAPPPPPPPVRPEKITISANVQCVFEIDK